MQFKTGLKFSPKPPEFRLADYIDKAALPKAPAVFGHANMIGRKKWGMLGNDEVGDCTIAGAMHAVMLWTGIAGTPAQFSTQDALDDYENACGYVPGDPDSDQGGDMVTVAKYWRNTGMRDTTTRRHQIAAYLAINANNLDHLDLAAYWFDAVGLGVELPTSAERQFINGDPWSVMDNDGTEGGHYIPYVQKVADNTRQVVTWGGLQDVEEAWLRKYLREVVVYISSEYLVEGKSPLGFDMSALRDDLQELA